MTAPAPTASAGLGLAGQLPAFSWSVRVYYEDTDAGGVVYYANYLRFFERCRTEWMRSLGFGQQELAQREGVLFVVATAEVQYLRSARLDDELLVDARLAERFGSYVIFEQAARRGAEVLCRARMKVACVDAQSMRPTRLPGTLADALALPVPLREPNPSPTGTPTA
jgi:acyl-CoA thioester hydrolase